MNNRVKHIIITIPIIILFLIMIKVYVDKDIEHGTSEFEIIDITTREKIDKATIIITELDKRYVITKENNNIKIPKKPYERYSTEKSEDKGTFPYGYTTITIVDGYLTRIDHNLILGYKDTKVTLEMLKETDVDGMSHHYNEHFHSYSPNIVYEILEYYKVNNRD